jgi:hypothetical protein
MLRLENFVEKIKFKFSDKFSKLDNTEKWILADIKKAKKQLSLITSDQEHQKDHNFSFKHTIKGIKGLIKEYEDKNGRFRNYFNQEVNSLKNRYKLLGYDEDIS